MIRKLNIYTLFWTVSVMLLSISCNQLSDSPYEDVVFSRVNSFSANGRSSATAFAVKGRAFVTMGRSGSRSGGLNDCWEFHPATATWTPKTAFPGLPRVNALAVEADSVAYVGLGFDVDHYDYFGNISLFRDFWCYHPSTDTWVKKDSFPGTFTDACIGFYRNGYVYAGLGFHNEFSTEMWKYSIQNNSWTQLKPFPGDFRACAIACADDQHVFIGTGYNTHNLNDWWEYFPVDDSWKKLRSIPDNGRQNAVAFAIGHRYFIASGRCFGGSETGGKLYDDLLEYDPAKNVWYARGTVPGGGRTNALSFVLDNKGYIGFGENDQTLLNDLWSFNP